MVNDLQIANIQVIFAVKHVAECWYRLIEMHTRPHTCHSSLHSSSMPAFFLQAQTQELNFVVFDSDYSDSSLIKQTRQLYLSAHAQGVASGLCLGR